MIWIGNNPTPPKMKKPRSNFLGFYMTLIENYVLSESFRFRILTSDLNEAEKKFRTTIFKENDTEKLTTAPTNANTTVRSKSSEPITGKVAKRVPPQVPTIVENDLKGIIIFIVNLSFYRFLITIANHRLTHHRHNRSSYSRIGSHSNQSCRQNHRSRQDCSSRSSQGNPNIAQHLKEFRCRFFISIHEVHNDYFLWLIIQIPYGQKPDGKVKAPAASPTVTHPLFQSQTTPKQEQYIREAPFWHNWLDAAKSNHAEVRASPRDGFQTALNIVPPTDKTPPEYKIPACGSPTKEAQSSNTQTDYSKRENRRFPLYDSYALKPVPRLTDHLPALRLESCKYHFSENTSPR